MKTIALPRSLESLVEFLNGLEERVPIDALREHLSGLDVTPDDLTPFMQFGDTCYQRNLICQGPWFELLCICWRDGQSSVIHNHADSTCGLRIITGTAVETTFLPAGDHRVRPIASREFVEGQVCCTQDDDIHQVRNCQADGSDLVTLHIYSPPLGEMQIWEDEPRD